MRVITEEAKVVPFEKIKDLLAEHAAKVKARQPVDPMKKLVDQVYEQALRESGAYKLPGQIDDICRNAQQKLHTDTNALFERAFKPKWYEHPLAVRGLTAGMGGALGASQGALYSHNSATGEGNHGRGAALGGALGAIAGAAHPAGVVASPLIGAASGLSQRPDTSAMALLKHKLRKMF